MRIRGDTLKRLAAERGTGREALAQAVERTGLGRDDALKAVGNWMAGRDHPRCKAGDVAKLAEALGVAAKDIAKFESRVVHHRGSPRKARLLADLVRGKGVDEALSLLSFTTKRAAVNVKKALTAAVADAELSEADVTALFVSESRVDEGPVMKRFQPKDRGRAHKILKRFSHITVCVEERSSGRPRG